MQGTPAEILPGTWNFVLSNLTSFGYPRRIPSTLCIQDSRQKAEPETPYSRAHDLSSSTCTNSNRQLNSSSGGLRIESKTSSTEEGPLQGKKNNRSFLVACKGCPTVQRCWDRSSWAMNRERDHLSFQFLCLHSLYLLPFSLNP